MSQPGFEETRDFIRRAHAKQRDKGGFPYHLHPEAVAERAVALLRGLVGDAIMAAPWREVAERARLVALMHDVLEDREYTGVVEADLRTMGHADDVVASVALLSRPGGDGRPTYIQWVRGIAASGDLVAILVKVADNEENSAPARIAQLPPEERGIADRYRRSLGVLRPALEAAVRAAR
jgi:(p)ppGpp synthase/HD superfamily hydrolase